MTNTPYSENLHFELFSIEEGLSSDRVSDITQAYVGFLKVLSEKNTGAHFIIQLSNK